MKIGDVMIIRGRKAIVRKIHAFGTVDVEILATGEWFRVSGLWG